MKTPGFRILAAALAALLPACGGDHGSGGGSVNPAFPVTMTEPSAGQTFTAPATISMSAVAADPGSVATVEFLQGAGLNLLLTGGQSGSDTSVVATFAQPPFQATLTDMPAGIHTFVARMTDKAGTQTFSNSVTISVLAPGESPGGWVPIARVPNLAGGGRSIWFVDADRGWIASFDQTIVHTEDGGASWVVQLGGSPTGTMGPKILQMQFVDAERGWAVGFGGPDGTVLRTTDGGATWTPGFVGPSTFVSALSFVDADVGWVAGASFVDGAPSGVVWVTKDGGVTWTPLATGLSSLDAVRFVDRLNGWAMGSVDFRGVILHTTDGGLTWSEQLRADLSVYFRAMDFVSATTGWVSRAGFLPEHNRILATNDGGATWTEQSYPGSDTISALDFVSPSQGWGTTRSAAIIHTDDGGASWVTQQGSGEPFGPGFMDVRFINANVGWALRQDGLLFKTTTGGKAP